jgi:uncharacterized protein (TIGR03067 family)
MKLLLNLWILLFCFSCNSARLSNKSSDYLNLQGIWLAETESQNGIKKNVAFQYNFNGNLLTFTDETGQTVKYNFELGKIKNLKVINIIPEGSPKDSKPVSVGYKLKSNLLKIVVAPPGLIPLDISDKNEQELIVSRRKKL